jgi:serine/threonine protein kinase
MLAPNALIQNRYLIESRIGGATSATYMAIDRTSRVRITLKQVVVGARAAEFERAARLLKGLRHPSLPVVRSYFIENGDGFLVMDFVDGEDLAVALERHGGPFPTDRVLRWNDQLLDALDYLHTQLPPVSHGNITPRNVKLRRDNDEIVLVGFDLLKGEAPSARATPSGGEIPPSSSFLPPEQLKGTASQLSDLFALSATLYYLLTGHPPTPVVERAGSIETGHPDPLPAPHTLNPKVPVALSKLVIRTLVLNPDERPAGADALRLALTQLPPEARKDVEIPQFNWWRRWPALAAAGVAVVALLTIILWRVGILSSASVAQNPTPQSTAAAVAAATSRPTTLLDATRTALPVVVETVSASEKTPAATSQVPTLVPPTDVPTPPLPTPLGAQIDSVEPESLFIDALPNQITMRGANLGQVRAARLVADGRQPIDATVISGGADQLVLGIPQPEERPNGEISYRIELDSVALDSPLIVLRDFLERKPAQAILPEYRYTGRVVIDQAGAYTAMRTKPGVNGQLLGQLRSGNEADILRTDVANWYQVRIHTSDDATQIGVVGWVERWLVDAIPLLFIGRVYDTPTDSATQCGKSFESSIYGSVENSIGKGIGGARLRITSADGLHIYDKTTDRNGLYSAPGLGCTTWTVRLISIPSAPNGIQANPVIVKNLNGGRLTAAEVRFKLPK